MVQKTDREKVGLQLVRQVRRIIEKRGLTQTADAKLLGIRQPDVSDLVRGKIGKFSTDRLFRFLNALDQNVEISLKPVRRESGGNVRVVRGRTRRRNPSKVRTKKVSRKKGRTTTTRKRKSS